MKFSVAAVLAAATSAAAFKGNATVTTEVVDVYTTYCPGPTQITHGSKTWTVTEATTLTITDCPCTITKPITWTSTTLCPSSTAVWTNGTAPSGGAPAGGNPGSPNTPGAPAGGAQPTGAVPTGTGSGSGSVPTAGAARVAGLSGVAGLVGLVAFAL